MGTHDQGCPSMTRGVWEVVWLSKMRDVEPPKMG